MNSEKLTFWIVLSLFVLVGMGISVSTGILFEGAAVERDLRQSAQLLKELGLKGSLTRIRPLESAQILRAYSLKESNAISYIAKIECLSDSRRIQCLAHYSKDGVFKSALPLSCGFPPMDTDAWPSDEVFRYFNGQPEWKAFMELNYQPVGSNTLLPTELYEIGMTIRRVGQIIMSTKGGSQP